MAKDMVCLRCEDVVKLQKQMDITQGVGMVVFLIGFALWPLLLLGLVMMIGGGKKRCPRCKGGDLVPPDSGSGRRIIEGRR